MHAFGVLACRRARSFDGLGQTYQKGTGERALLE